jgi:hypothetical protein
VGDDPDKAKDVRQWVFARNPDLTIADAWHDLGDIFRKAIEEACRTAEAVSGKK